jgi:hypothetical protein
VKTKLLYSIVAVITLNGCASHQDQIKQSIQTDRFKALAKVEGLKYPATAQLTPTFWTCAKQCEGDFSALASRINELESAGITARDPNRAAQLIAEANNLKSKAKLALHFCLTSCPPPPKTSIYVDTQGHLKPFSLGEFESEIYRAYLYFP